MIVKKMLKLFYKRSVTLVPVELPLLDFAMFSFQNASKILSYISFNNS